MSASLAFNPAPSTLDIIDEWKKDRTSPKPLEMADRNRETNARKEKDAK